MEFGKKLKKLRLEKGLSQQKLADIIFVSRSAVAKWENGLGLPSEESRQALAQVFAVSPDDFTTEAPGQVIVEKNRKIKKLSGSMCAVLTALAAALILFHLFHPVPYCASAACKKIEVQLFYEKPFEITDRETVEALLDLLNAASFQKSLRVDAGRSAPDSMRAMLILRGSGGPDDTIMLCLTPSQTAVYLFCGAGELRAVHPEPLSGYLVQLIQAETARRGIPFRILPD